MTLLTNQLFTLDYNTNIINGLYKTLLEQLLEDGWKDNGDTAVIRQQMIVASNHNLAVMLDWVQGKAVEAFKYINGYETDKYVRNLYLVRIAVQDMVEALVGEDVNDAVIKSILSDVVTQVRREIVPSIGSNAAYTIDEADEVMDTFWYFMTDGMVGTKQEFLSYGTDVLVFKGEVVCPKTLVNTGDEVNDDDFVANAIALEDLYMNKWIQPMCWQLANTCAYLMSLQAHDAYKQQTPN